MGIGHQQNFFIGNSQHRYQSGGELRKKKAGRKQRPLSTKEPLHVVFKINKANLKGRSLRNPQSFLIIQKIFKKYGLLFSVKIEQLSIQNDHLHLLIRAPRRAKFHHFFRVVAGQIAQVFAKEGLLRILSNQHVTDTPNNQNTRDKAGTSLWKYRPFSRVVRGWRTYKIVRDYIQLNEKEARGGIPYRKERLKGLSSADWQILWC